MFMIDLVRKKQTNKKQHHQKQNNKTGIKEE